MQIDLVLLENVLKLMKKYKLSEYSDNNFSIKSHPLQPQQKRAPRTKVASEQEAFQQHLEALDKLPQEPWDAVTDNDLQAFSLNGKAS